MFKTIKEEDVKSALVALIDKNGTTTALDVKKDLRKNGFWATQSNVSQLIGEVYHELDITRTNNGSYFVYEYEKLPTDDLTDDEEDDSIVGDNYSVMPAFTRSSTGSTMDFGVSRNTQSVQPTPKSKIIGDTKMLADDTYQLTIEHEGKTNKLLVSDRRDLKSFGALVYEVRTGKGDWYLYSEDKDIITRHKAIYYVWKVISQEYDGFLAYADMRSTKLCR